VPEPSFTALARQSAPSLDHLALALAAEFGPVDVPDAMRRLDALAGELAEALAVPDGDPSSPARALAGVLGERHGFAGPPAGREAPAHALLDRVLQTRRGGSFALCVVYAEVARRVRLPVWGVGVDGGLVVGHFGERPPRLIDPLVGGRRLPEPLAPRPARPRSSHEIARGLLDELVRAYLAEGEIARAARAAELRLELPLAPADREAARRDALALHARQN
jgi:regulator of sirC expression with transglutaminase-like and TPR domain